MATLTGRSPKDTYGDLLQVSNANDGVDSTLRFVSDGKGTNSSLKISSASAQFTGTLTSTGLLTTTAGIVSGSDIKSDTDSTDDLGSTGVRWANLWVDNITMGGTIAGAVATFSSTMTVTGLTTATGGIVTSGTIIFEGATADAHETTLTVVDPTADRTVSLPNATDTLVGKATTDTLTNKTLTSPVLNTGLSGTAFLDEDNMASNSATKAASQQSIKAYVDAQVDTADTLSEILAIGNTTGGTDVSVSTDDKVQFRDAAIYINSSTDGQLDIVADTEIQIAATTIDINGAVALNGALTGITNITLSGELDAATGDFSGDVDVDGTLEADAITLGGTALGSIYSPIAGSSSIVTTGALNSGSITSGFGTINNGSSSITTTGALGAGAATFGGNVTHGSAAYVTLTDYGTSANSRIITGGTNTATGYLAVAQWNGSAYVNTVSFSGSDSATTFAGAATVSGGLNVIGTNNTTSTLLLSNTSGTDNNWSFVPAYNAQTLAVLADSTTVLTLNEDTSATFAGNINAVAGGINLGATGSANLLDDYEEGTWTPAVGYAGGSPSTGYAAQVGTYVKVGKMVNANIYIVTNAHTAGTGQLSISGFPFTAKPNNTYYSGTIGYMQGIAGGATTNTVIPYLPGNTTAMAILSTNNSAVANIAFTNATHIMVNITYEAA